MRTLFLGHNPLAGPLLAGGEWYVQFEAQPQRDLSPKVQSLADELAKQNLRRVDPSRIITEAPKGGTPGFDAWHPYKFWSEPEQLEVISRRYNALPAGATDVRRLLELTKKYNDKFVLQAIVEKHFPEYAIPHSEVVENLTPDRAKHYLTEHGPSVAKTADGAGGHGTTFITPDTTIDKPVMLQPWIPHIRSPSITMLISETGIDELYTSDQQIAGATYLGSDFPSKTSHQQAISTFAQRFARALKDDGYRGLLNIDLIETDDHIYFCEVNARTPYSIYPHTFAKNHLQGPYAVRQRNTRPTEDGIKEIRGLAQRTSVFFMSERDGVLRYRFIEPQDAR